MKTILIILALVTGATAEPVTIALKSGGTMTGPLVAKSANEIKIETAYGIISLQPGMVTPESWTAAQRATTSKPIGKYVKTPVYPQKTTVESKPQLAPQEPRAIRISTASLEAAYDKNPLAADSKYKGQRLIVTGTIRSFGKSIIIEHPYVGLGESVTVYFPAGSEKKLMNLAVGQAVTLSGVCRGKGLGIIDLKSD